MRIVVQDIDKKEIENISNKLNISLDCAALLKNRNISEDIMEVICNNDFYELLPYDSIKNIPEACSIISKYLENDDAIIYIFSDYDNDGIQSTFIAYDCLTALTNSLDSKCKIEYYVPERKEGYGLNINWCYDIVNNDIDNNNILVITVDNGITKKYEVDYLKMNNIEVIITDHHCPQENMIPNCIIVNELLDNENEYMGLCGAGVIFKICSYLLCDYYEDDSDYNLFYLPNVATATISDMVPITLENSIFVRNGLYMLNNKECECFDSLEHYMNFRGYKELIPKDIAFEFGPQINACGRMGEANTAIDFMLSNDNKKLIDLYNKVIVLNEQRKKKTNDLFIEVQSQINNETDSINTVICNEAGGCAGLLANKIMDLYNKPSIVFTEHENSYSGSVRSIEGINIQQVLKELQDLNIVKSYGGHELACGVEVEKDKFDIFKDTINAILYKMFEQLILESNNIEQFIIVDKQITVKDISFNTIDKYSNILFYNDLNLPRFYLENVTIDFVKESSNNPDNIKFAFRDKTGKANAWCWRYGNIYKDMGSPRKVNMVIELEKFNTQIVVNMIYMEAA